MGGDGAWWQMRGGPGCIFLWHFFFAYPEKPKVCSQPGNAEHPEVSGQWETWNVGELPALGRIRDAVLTPSPVQRAVLHHANKSVMHHVCYVCYNVAVQWGAPYGSAGDVHSTLESSTHTHHTGSRSRSRTHHVRTTAAL